MLLDALEYVPTRNEALVLAVLLVVIWPCVSSLRVYSTRPTGVTLVGPSLKFGKWLSSLSFLAQGSETILKSYRELHESRPLFAILALNEYQVLVSHPDQIQELARGPKNVLSFHAAMKDRLNHRQIMYGFEHNDVDPHDTIPIHSLKFCLRKALPDLGPVLRERVREGFNQYRSESSSPDGARVVSVFGLAKAVCGRASNQILFGTEMATNKEFDELSTRYGWDGAIAMELCRLVPAPCAKFLGWAVMAWSGAMNKVGKRVAQMVDKRLRDLQEKPDADFVDCTQFVIDVSRTPQQKAPFRIAQQMVALQFASAHQLPMALAWAIIMLCKHSEYAGMLREEISEAKAVDGSVTMAKLRLMDNFLRETARLNPLDGLSIQRKAIKPYTFADGSHIPAGNLLAVPQEAILRDERYYPRPEGFDPWRFYTSTDSNEATIKFTDVNWTFPFWGSPTQSCPGRWYASDVIKYALIHLLENYNMEPVKPIYKPMIWTTAIVPSLAMRVMLTPRTGSI